MNKLINPCFGKWLHRFLFWLGYVAIVCDVVISGILKRGFRTLLPPYRRQNHL